MKPKFYAEMLVKLKKNQPTERFNGDLNTRSFLRFRGEFLGWGGGWGDQNRTTDFENSVIRPVFC